jgi:mono/diheme cytochrome c family protein
MLKAQLNNLNSMNMKSNLGFKLAALLLLTSLAMSCEHDNAVPPTPYESADGSIGGIMYDKFWAEESGFNQTDPNIDLYNDNANFFRCKQCHAWDGLGTMGSYNSRGPNDTRPNVANFNLYEMAQTKTPQELYTALTKTDGRRPLSYDPSQYNPSGTGEEGDQMPNLNEILSDAQIWDLVKFLKDGMFDVSELYDGTYQGVYPLGQASYANIGKDGNATAGDEFYADNCAGCHGADGNSLSLDGKGVGGFTRAKPYEVQQKVQYGQLGSSMAGEFDMTIDQMRDLYKALSDESNYPETLPPPTDVSFANDVQPIYNGKCIGCHSTAGDYGGIINLETGISYGQIVPTRISSPASSSLIYTKPQPGHFASYSSAESAIVLAWIEEGALDN